MRLRFVILLMLVLTATGISVAVFAEPSKTSTGLASVSAHGRPVSFASITPAKLVRLGTPRVLAQRRGRAFFRVGRLAARRSADNVQGSCFGIGKLSGGKLTVLLVDCTRFPLPNRPVLDEVGVEIRDRLTHRASVLFIEGFAADGVAELRLLGDRGDVVSRAPVVNNVFSFSGVAGRSDAGSTLVAVDPEGREVWRRVL